MNNLVDSYPQAGSSLMESLASLLPSSSGKQKEYTAIFRKFVRTSACDNPWKVLWVVLSSLLKEGYDRPWTYVCESERKATKVGSTAIVSGTVYWSYPMLPFRIVTCTFFDNLSQNSCILPMSCAMENCSTYYVLINCASNCKGYIQSILLASKTSWP